MTITGTFSLFIALIILAAIPGPGVFTVVARSMASGFVHGAVTIMGIVFGDYIFIILSLFGLSALVNNMEALFIAIKFAGVIYLIALGLTLIFRQPALVDVQPVMELFFFSNFLAGLITTLSNPKAILFYVSFFPAFVSFQHVTMLQIAQLLLVVTLAVGSVMVVYAYSASKASDFFKNARASRILNYCAGAVMICSGALIAVRG